MTHADLIVINARVTTMTDGAADATALAVRDGRFIAVGSEADVLAHLPERTRVIDAGGRRIVPGLNDSHIHLIRGGLNYNLELRWDGVPSLADALRMLKQQAAARRRRSGCAWSAAGASSSSPSGACRRSPRSTRPRPTRRCSCCTSTTGPGSTAPRCARSATRRTRPIRRAA